MAGEIATIGTFSFFPSKNLGGYGDGGMMVTQDEALADAAQAAPHARRREAVFPRRSRLQQPARRAAGGGLSAKLPHLAGWSAKRRANAAYYDAGARGHRRSDHAVHRSRQRVDLQSVHDPRRAPRRSCRRFSRSGASASAIYYPLPLHLQPCFAYLGYKAGSCPGVGTRGARSAVAADLSRADAALSSTRSSPHMRAFYGRLRSVDERTTAANAFRIEPPLIGVIGLGYVGLPLAVEFAQGGLPRHRLRRERARLRAPDGGRVAHPGRPGVGGRGARRAASSRRRPTRRVSPRPTRSRSPFRRRSAKTRDPDMSYVDRGGGDGRRGRRTPACSSCSRARPTRARRARCSCPRSTERGLTVGEDVFVAFSPERVDPGNPSLPHEEHAESRRRHHAALHRARDGAVRRAASTPSCR